MSGEHWKKLEEIMIKCGAGTLKDGDIASDKWREFIDKLHYHYVTHDRSQIRITKPKFLTKPDTSKCPKLDEGELEEMGMTFSELCKNCHDRALREWENCSAKR